MNKPVTLADIAKLAGVSRATASRALRDSSLISEATKKRVQDIAREHNYRPNLVARSLRLKQSHTIVFVLPSLRNQEQLLDPFLSKFIGSLTVALREHNYDLLIAHSPLEDSEIGVRYLRSGRADGIIFIGRTTANEHLVAQMAADEPMVVWGPLMPGQTYCSVGIDNQIWSQRAVEHLLSLGRRRIAFLGEDPSWIEVIHRYAGYEAAMQQTGLAVDEALVTHIAATDRGGKEAMQQLLARSPEIDAVFANSDVAAIAAMQVLQANGRSVPNDVAVIGFDNITIGRYTSPALTTVSQNLTEGVPLLVEKLLQLVKGETADSAIIPGQLVVRQSCGAN